MYDKFAHILQIETIVNDIKFFKHYRDVIRRDCSSAQKEASMKKNTYSLKRVHSRFFVKKKAVGGYFT